ncbi:MAG TPA: hypothetical protein VEZ89_11965 [Rubrivivax sp.]|nr:hypothetical protein [Rubrivivax sp.]
MKPTPPAYAAAITLYLAAGGAAQVLWLDVAGTALHPAAAFVCALPTLLVGLLALTGRADAPQYRSGLLACGALLPLLLLLWSQTQVATLPPVVTALHALLVLGCHAAAVTAAMDRLDLRWPEPPRLQFSWVTSLVFR